MLFGIKKGMSAIFKNDKRYPVTCILIPQHHFIKEVLENDRILIGIEGKSNVVQTRMFNSLDVPNCRELMEISKDLRSFIENPDFKIGQHLDIRGTTKGKGFQGAMKRWGFKGQSSSHGVSRAHRSIGSTGNNTSPAKVFKGKKMAGKMGNKLRWQSNLQVVDFQDNYLFVKGSVPGSDESLLLLRNAIHRAGKILKFQDNPILQ